MRNLTQRVPGSIVLEVTQEDIHLLKRAVDFIAEKMPDNDYTEDVVTFAVFIKNRMEILLHAKV